MSKLKNNSKVLLIILLIAALCAGFVAVAMQQEGVNIVLADDDEGGGGAGDSGDPGQPGAGPGAVRWGVTHVWFDRGSKDPEQGEFKLGMSDVPDKMYDKFINLISSKLGLQYNPSDWTERLEALRKAMKTACERAIARSGNNESAARVVGVGITWGTTDNVHWRINAFGDPTSFDYVFENKRGTSSELPDAYGWNNTVSQTKYSQANANESWRNYIYRMGQIDNANVNYTGDTWNVYVVAVTNSEPENFGYLKIKKSSVNNFTYDNENILYTTEDCKFRVTRTDGDGEQFDKVFSTNSNGWTDVIEVPLGTYRITETAAPGGHLLDSEPIENIVITSAHTEDNPYLIEGTGGQLTNNQASDPLTIKLEKKLKDE